MGKYIEAPRAKTYKFNQISALSNANIFQLVGKLIENVSETTKSRNKTARELIDETLSFRLNILENLALHFSKEAMMAEKNKDLVLSIFDIVTFKKR